VKGRWIVLASWWSLVVFGAATLPEMFGVDAFDPVGAGVSLLLFFVGTVACGVAYVQALARTTRGDDVTVPALFFLSGSAPLEVRQQIFGSGLILLVVSAATAASNPFSVLVNMLPFGLAGIWAVRYGTFPPRRATARTVTPGRSSGRPTGKTPQAE
jgi:hypothetical protein